MCNFQTSSFDDIAIVLDKWDNFIISGHINPDGDSVGSTLGLACMLEKLKKKVICLYDDPFFKKANYDFLPNYVLFVESEIFYNSQKFTDIKKTGFCFVTVDAQNEKRIGKYASKIKENCKVSFTFDHHLPEPLCSNYNYIDHKSAACALIIWDFCKSFCNFYNKELDKNIALCCYAGLCSDTNCFINNNTDIKCFSSAIEMIKYDISIQLVVNKLFQSRSLASYKLEQKVLEHMIVDKKHRFALSYLLPEDFEKYNAVKRDTDALNSVLLSIDCVDFMCILRQLKKEEKIHGSMRSCSDIDVSKIANLYNGGGHKSASGLVMDCYNMEDAVDSIKKNMIKHSNVNL